MATVITEDCINCGACEPECPNDAIYQGGVDYEHDGNRRQALSNDFFFIVPDKCTECVGFFDEEACAVVCPVDCCVPDPDRPETEEALLQRARQLHPENDFGEEFPSRFRQGGGGTEAAPAAPATEALGATAVSGESGLRSASGDGGASSMAGTETGMAPAPRVEKALRPAPGTKTLDGGDPSRAFKGELGLSFSEVMDVINEPVAGSRSSLRGLGLFLLAPLVGAMRHEAKLAIERALGDTRFFSVQSSTALNVFLNFLLYPAIAVAVGFASGLQPFTEGDRNWIVAGIGLALFETLVRFRQGLRGVPVSDMKLGASVYGAPLSLIMAPLLKRMGERQRSGRVPVEGFHGGEFEAKRERERRYGEVYEVEERAGGYYIRFELPRRVPQSSARDEMGIGQEMPDYDVDLSVNGSEMLVRASTVDRNLRAVSAVSSAFPPDFSTTITLANPVAGFRHRYSDKVLEIAVVKRPSG